MINQTLLRKRKRQLCGVTRNIDMQVPYDAMAKEMQKIMLRQRITALEKELEQLNNEDKLWK